MRITLENMSVLERAVISLLTEENHKADNLHKAMTVLGFKLRDEWDDVDNTHVDVAPLRELWRVSNLGTAVRRWNKVQTDALRWGRTAFDNDRAKFHRRTIDRQMPKLIGVLVSMGLTIGKVYDK